MAEASAVPDSRALTQGWTVTELPGYSPALPGDPVYGASENASGQLPQALSFPSPQGKTYILSTQIVLTKEELGQELWILAGRSNAVVEVYINGEFLGRSGTPPPNLNYFAGVGLNLLLPAALLKTEAPNLLQIKLYRESGAVNYTPPLLGLRTAVDFDNKVLAFLNTHIYSIFSSVSLFIFAFFILQFLYRPKERVNLLYGLANLFFAIYFLRIGDGLEMLPFFAAFAVTKGFLPLAFASLTLFFIESFGLFNKRPLKILIAAVGVFLFAAITLAGTDIGTADIIFTLSLLPSQIEIFFIVVITVIAIRRGDRKAWIVLVGCVWGVALGTHDIIAMLAGVLPFAWLQGIGIFGFNLAMFALLAVKTMETQKALEVSTLVIKQKQESLESYVDNIKTASVEVSGIIRELDDLIRVASEGMSKMAVSTANINHAVEDEFITAAGTQATLGELLDSVETVYRGVEAQALSVQATAATVEQMLGNLGTVTESLRQTADFTNKLKDVVTKGEKAVFSSMTAMNRIKSVSEKISLIIDAVNDLAEKTNLLAMNAAIEAAHAGQSGRGFAVVASEIKRLAMGSSDRAREIGDSIQEIMESIEQGSAVSGQVRDVLVNINRDTASAAGQVQSLYDAFSQQQIASRQIQDSMNSLREASASIRAQADKQARGSRIIRSGMEELVTSLSGVRLSVQVITQQVDAITLSSTRIREISQEGRGLVERLDKLMERKES